MARTKAISLIQNGATKVELAELSGLVIQNIQKDTLASGLKSQSYTGNPAAGSVEYRRFKNSVSQDYGTARAAGKGTALTVPPTTVNLNTHKEIVEEAAKFDLDTFGVGNIMARRADNHVDTVAAEFDTAFFKAAFDEGTAFTAPAGATDPGKIVEALIQTLVFGPGRERLGTRRLRLDRTELNHEGRGEIPALLHAQEGAKNNDEKQDLRRQTGRRRKESQDPICHGVLRRAPGGE